MFRETARITYKVARRITIAVVGVTVLLGGLVMIFLPGPAILVIPLGLAILSVEFAWARHWLQKIRRRMSENAIKSVGKNSDRYY